MARRIKIDEESAICRMTWRCRAGLASPAERGNTIHDAKHCGRLIIAPSNAPLGETITTAEVFGKINRRIKVDANHFPTIAQGLHRRKDGMPSFFSIDDVQHTLQEQNCIAEHNLTAAIFLAPKLHRPLFFIGN